MRTAAGSAAKKYDEFPSPHGFARAEDYIGYGRISHFWIENCSFDPRRYVRFWVISGHFGVFGHVRFSAEGQQILEKNQSAKEKAASRTRLNSIDFLRGLVMIMMALDHTRGFLLLAPSIRAM